MKAQTRQAGARWKWDSVVLVGLPLAQMLEDILTFRVGPVYFTPMKFWLLLGGLAMLKHCHPHVVARSDIASPFLSAFLFYGALQTVSVMYAENLYMSERANYLLYNAAALATVYGLARAFAIEGHQRFVCRFRKAIAVIFYSSLLLGTVQVALRGQVLRNVGGCYVVGFNVERLFLCEFLTIGLASALLRPGTFLWKGVLALWVIIVVYATNSFTGALGLSLVILTLPVLRVRYLVLLCAAGALGYMFVPMLNAKLFSPGERLYQDYKYRTNIQEYEKSNWRYWSSVLLVEESLESPTVLGHGYKENEKFLTDAYERFFFAKHGKEDREKRNISSHTILSVAYDQGLVGMVAMTAVLCLSVAYCLRLIVSRPKDEGLYVLSRLTIVVVGLMLLRILLYYHSLPRWHFLVAAVFLNTTWYWRKRHPRTSERVPKIQVRVKC